MFYLNNLFSVAIFVISPSSIDKWLGLNGMYKQLALLNKQPTQLCVGFFVSARCIKLSISLTIERKVRSHM